MEWISVKDKLPKVDIEDGDFMTSKKVIAILKNKGENWVESVTLKKWYEDDEAYWYFDYDSEVVENSKITHWHPLVFPE